MKTCFIPNNIIDPDVIYTQNLGNKDYIIFQNALKEIKFELNPEEKDTINELYSQIRGKFLQYKDRDYVDLRLVLKDCILDQSDTEDDEVSN